MKLRIKGNSIRLRLTQSEIAQLNASGLVEEKTEFGAMSQSLIYALEATNEVKSVTASYENNWILVQIPSDLAENWINSNQVGIEAEQTISEGRSLRILIEKDFACLKHRAGEDDADAFANPVADD